MTGFIRTSRTPILNVYFTNPLILNERYQTTYARKTYDEDLIQ